MTDSALAKPGIMQLWKLSFADVKKFTPMALVLSFLFAGLMVVLELYQPGKSSSYSFINILIGFFWLTTIADVSEAPTVKQTTKRMGWFFVYSFLCMAVLIAGGIGCGIAFGAFSGDDPSMLSIFAGVMLAGLVCLCFVFVFPAAAFGHKTSPVKAWKQGRGWYLKLLGTLAPLIILQFAIIFVLAWLTPPLPEWVMTGAGAFFGNVLNLVCLSVVAHAYRAARLTLS